MSLPYRITPEGDAALMIRFADDMTPQVNALVHAARARLAQTHVAGVTDLLGAYCTLMVCYDPLTVSYTELSAQVGACLRGLEPQDAHNGRVIEIPVCYGGDLGPDLPDVARHAGLSADQVVALHAAGDYTVCMLGFLPGFAYLWGLDERLATPRLETPRVSVPAGSVAIGGAQTGVYPMASPGGWRIIGSTPARLYDPHRDEPIPYAAGDVLRFVPIDRQRYDELAALAAAGRDVTSTRRP